MTSASHAEGRQFDPGQVYEFSPKSMQSHAPLPFMRMVGVVHRALQTMHAPQKPSVCEASATTNGPHTRMLLSTCKPLAVADNNNDSDSPNFTLSTCGLVAMTSAQHAEGRQFDPGWVYSIYDSAA